MRTFVKAANASKDALRALDSFNDRQAGSWYERCEQMFSLLKLFGKRVGANVHQWRELYIHISRTIVTFGIHMVRFKSRSMPVGLYIEMQRTVINDK